MYPSGFGRLRDLLRRGSSGPAPLNPMNASVAPAAIYSMRKVNPAYSGACVRMRNSAGTQADIGWTTDPAGSGFQIIDMAALTAHANLGNGTFTFVRWYDQSGNGRDFVYGSTARILQPATMPRASGAALPTLDFDGSFTGAVSTATAIPAGWLSEGGTNNLTIFATLNVMGPVTTTSGAQPRSYPTNIANFDAVMFSTAGSADANVLACTSEALSGQTCFGKTGARNVTAVDYPFARSYPLGLGLTAVPALQFTASRKATYWFNQKGALVSGGGGGIQSFADRPHGRPSATAQHLILGTRNGSRPSNSQFAEVIVYNNAGAALTDIECQRIDIWTQQFWGAVQTPRVPMRVAMALMGESTAQAVASGSSNEASGLGDTAWARIVVPNTLALSGRSYTNTDLVLRDASQTALAGSQGLRPRGASDGDQTTPGTWQGTSPSKNAFTKFWWDQINNIPGPCYWNWYDICVNPTLGASGLAYIDKWMIALTQGINDTEIGDTDPTGKGVTFANWKAGWKSIIARARADSGKADMAFFFYMLQRPVSGATKELRMRDLWQEITTELPYCYMLPEGGIASLSGDSTHPQQGPGNTAPNNSAPAYGVEGYDRIANMIARSFARELGGSAPYLGPALNPVAQAISPTVTRITATYPAGCGGTDFAPSSGIFGFSVFDNGSPRAVSAAVRVDANTIDVTHAAVSGARTWQYVPNQSQGVGIDAENGVRIRDNTLGAGDTGLPASQLKGGTA